MTRTPLHIARVSDGEPPTIEVLDSNEIARGFLEVATELWRLAGHEDRAIAIENLITSAYKPTRRAGRARRSRDSASFWTASSRALPRFDQAQGGGSL
ncbi:MAG TPA: hypothetical protein VNO30_08175 [Kofleriaceae bacterium]|nr:hypothetical protein [Kofleriaceae bacterium]